METVLRRLGVGSVVLGVILSAGACGTTSGKKTGVADERSGEAKDAPENVMVLCPVTENRFGPPREALKTTYKGQTYYFCCPGCKDEFDADPERFVGKGAVPQ